MRGRKARGSVRARSGGRGLVRSAAERHRAAVRSECAAGAGLSRLWSQRRRRRWGGCGRPYSPHPARRGRILPSIVQEGESWWRQGERLTVPSQPSRTGTGPAGGVPGGRAGLGTGALGPGSRDFGGWRGGDQAGPCAAAGVRGAWEGRAGSGANLKRPSRAGRGLSRVAAPWGEVGCSLPGGRQGPLFSEGVAGVSRPVLGHVDSWLRCMGLYTQPSAPESVFWGRGGTVRGGRSCCVSSPSGQGIAG